MTVLTTAAHAKINLTLDVLRRRPDGYHDLQMVMQEIALGDELRLTLHQEGIWRIVCGTAEVPCDETNLALRAARLFFQAIDDTSGLTIELQKVTPVCAGLGGGSADAAAVLRTLYSHCGAPFSEAKLYKMAEKLGADVPFALFGGTALAEGKGQILNRLSSMPQCTVVLCKPDFPVSTPELYHQIDREALEHRPDTAGMLRAIRQGNIADIAQYLCNVFYPIVARNHPELYDIERILRESGALGASMSGSGPTMFGLFSDERAAETAFTRLKADYADVFLTKPVS